MNGTANKWHLTKRTRANEHGSNYYLYYMRYARSVIPYQQEKIKEGFIWQQEEKAVAINGQADSL